MKTANFKNWFDAKGTDLLKGWLRAKDDGNDEPFQDWVLGEYAIYREKPSDYEIPYHGIMDGPVKAEIAVFGPTEYEIRMTDIPGTFAVIEKEHESEVLHTGRLVDCENWIKEQEK